MDQDALEAVLADLPLLDILPPEARQLLLERFERVSAPFGTEIVREGETVEALHVVAEGRVRLVKRAENGDELSLTTLRRGDSFGEQGLLEDTPSAVTARASSDVELLRLDRSVFDTLLEDEPELRHYFQLQARHRHLYAFFREFTGFAKLPPEALALLLAKLEPEDVSAGTVIIREGDPPGPLYVIQEGRCRVHVAVEGQNRRRTVAYLRRGEYFGERSVFEGEPRTATVEAVSSCRLLKLTQETYQALLEQYPDFRAAVGEQTSQYDYKHTAMIPLDFAQEILPAETRVSSKVDVEQVDQEDAGEAAAEEDPFAEDGRFIKKAKRIRRFPHLFQIDEMDCGAACLGMICRHYGRTVSLARIRQVIHTSLDGTSLKALCEGASEIGLAARSVKTTPGRLDQLPLPAIVHFDGYHWVVLYHVSKTHVWLADPAHGHRKLPREEFAERWSGYAALFDPTEEFATKAPEGKLGLAWLLPFFKPYGGLVAKAAGLALVVSALEMVVPVVTQVIVDRVLVEQDVPLLHLMVFGMAAVVVLGLVGTIVQRYLLSFAAVRIDAATLDHLTRRLLSLPMHYFNSRRTGDIQRRLAGIWQVRDFVVEHGVEVLTSGTQLVAALVLMTIYSPTLTLVFLATVPLFLVLMHLSSRWLGPLYTELEESYGKYQSFQIDAIKGIETVKALGAEHAWRDLMVRQFNALARARFKADFTVMGYSGLTHTVTLLTVVLFLLVGARQVMAGQLSIGALVAFNSLVALANGALMGLLGLWDDLQQVTVYLARLDDIFQQEPEQGEDRTRLLPVRSLEGKISLRHLGFRYGGPGAPAILEDISVEIPPDTMVAIVGRSGSGKTTLIKCLAGLLEPTEGTILYDGIDMKTLNYRDLRRKIGFVLQENHLFDDTIARNIAFGEEEPDLDKVMWAAQVANAREFIERLPMGYDTKIGESGLSLSGGQRQRVAIARAIYQRPPVLIFDEATSALDTESERAVKEGIDQLLQGRTSFVIAHRLSTVRDADLILVLEQGRLVEQGTHEDLMKRQGLYFYLVSQQLGI
ncbi:MAG: peptidase domain-containing ABC transporter [Gemmatimonadetes bacterium]|nr:peptidase domain-containing ABC transporter [Gemmatimonadota bacterium]